MRRHILSLALLTVAFGVCVSRVAAQNGTVVPPDYVELYSVLETSLENYNAYLASLDSEITYPVVYGAELLPANSNRGESLLVPQTMSAVELFLDRFQQLGIQGVTVPVSYPLYTPDFPRYAEYVRFFKQVAQKVREHGMTLALESSIIFANTPFSTLRISYDDLTFEKFKSERRRMVQAIIQDLSNQTISTWVRSLTRSISSRDWRNSTAPRNMLNT